MSFDFAEFFAGVGLVRLALEDAGWHCVFANDIDPDKARIYRQNFGSSDLLVGDIANVGAEDLPAGIRLLTASFPCVDLSLAGGRAGLDGRESGTVWEFLRVVEEMRADSGMPEYILMENVLGFLTSCGGRDIVKVLRRLADLGYRSDVFQVDARHFVPQSRPRLFILAGLEGAGDSRISARREFCVETPELRPPAIERLVGAHSEISWGRVEFPRLPRREQGLASIVETVPLGSKRWWSEERVTKLYDQMSPKHQGVVDGLRRGATLAYATVFRRTRPTGSMAEVRNDGLAGCLRTPRGGSSKQILLVAGNGELRARLLTPREYARLQGVPEWFRCEVPENQGFFAFGDAVCVPVVAWIAQHALPAPSAPSHERVTVEENGAGSACGRAPMQFCRADTN